MPDRTEELRELFESVTGTDSVTERQQRSHGTLSGTEEIRAALADAIDSMREDLDFETDLPTAVLVTVVERFYEGDSDEAIMTEISERHDAAIDSESLARARLDLHLVRAEDRPPEDVIADLRAIQEGSKSVASVASALDREAETVRHWVAVRETQAQRRRTADRYRQSFETLLADRDIAERLTASLEETGLDEAVADQEVDVDM